MADPDARRPTVLIVDYHADVREAYAELLRGNRLQPITASSGESALELAFRLRPDVLVVAMEMPGMDGFEIVRALRADDRTRETPVIGFTNAGFSQRRAEEAGCDAFFRKTSPPEGLLTILGKVLRARS
jgi:CheY-like chemotaxis protein